MIRLPFCFLLCLAVSATAEDTLEFVVQSRMMHLRRGELREWHTFSEHADAEQLNRIFAGRVNESSWTIRLRQVDVKQSWQIKINDRVVGTLVRDENDFVSDFEIPANTLHDGDNRLQIVRSGGDASDDILVGEIEIHRVAPSALRGESTVLIDVVDGNHQPIPARITIVDDRGVLQPVHTQGEKHLAVREGVVYTSTGSAKFGVAAGKFRIYASRGFEYNAPSAVFTIDPGVTLKRTLVLQREVDTAGWVACDTHVHTVTHSGHGDCTIDERMATIAGEGIELVIATDHNKHIDYREIADAHGVDQYFTPVIGNEVTTKQGHFNIFPVAKGAPVPSHQTTNWDELFEEIYTTPDVKIAILNHPRDIHSGFRPFSRRHHISVSGENMDGNRMQFNAMEMINSGAVQVNVKELLHDWCGLINRGRQITPVGASDSHDVSRYIVGQGRTYIQCADDDPGNIDVDKAVAAFQDGRVIVSYGLMVKLSIHKARNADRIKLDTHSASDRPILEKESIEVTAEVLGPSWARCNQVSLYVNGPISPMMSWARPMVVSDEEKTQGVLRKARWRLTPASAPELASDPPVKQDVWLTAFAFGPGVDQPFWKTAKPYQMEGTTFHPYTFSCSGAIKLDLDGDGKYSSPYDYACQIADETNGDIDLAIKKLDRYHGAVAVQYAALMMNRGVDVQAEQYHASLLKHRQAGSAIGYYMGQRQGSQRARVERRE